MKKVLAAILVIFILVQFTGCVRLPNPEPVVTSAVAAAKDASNPLSGQTVSEAFNLTPELASDPEVISAIEGFLAALYSRITYTIQETSVNKKERTAKVLVLVNTFDFDTLYAQFETATPQLLLQWFAEDPNLTQGQLTVKLFQYYTEVVGSATLTPRDKTVELSLIYNDDTREWEVTNPEVLNAVFL